MKFKSSAFEQMRQHLENAYPYEGCGIMLGRDNTILNIVEGTNIKQERREDRFLLDPSDILKAEKYAKQNNVEILGFYHSHPDHPAKPSITDLENAWEGYYYIIVSIDKGKIGKLGLYRLSEKSNEFIEETINIED
jgi:proteasome lid subunit RPN8/RPN11